MSRKSKRPTRTADGRFKWEDIELSTLYTKPLPPLPHSHTTKLEDEAQEESTASLDSDLEQGSSQPRPHVPLTHPIRNFYFPSIRKDPLDKAIDWCIIATKTVTVIVLVFMFIYAFMKADVKKYTLPEHNSTIVRGGD